MSQVEFQEGGSNGVGGMGASQSSQYSRFQGNSDTPKMVRWLMDKGIVKNQSQANVALISIMAFFIVATLVVVFKYVL